MWRESSYTAAQAVMDVERKQLYSSNVVGEKAVIQQQQNVEAYVKTLKDSNWDLIQNSLRWNLKLFMLRLILNMYMVVLEVRASCSLLIEFYQKLDDQVGSFDNLLATELPGCYLS